MVEDFVCDYCGEECDGYFRFRVDIITSDNEKETAISCPDCIATWLTETPEDFIEMKIKKQIVVD